MSRSRTSLLVLLLITVVLLLPVVVNGFTHASWSVAAQSLPFTPTPEPTTRASATPTTRASATPDILPTPWPQGLATETPSAPPVRTATSSSAVNGTATTTTAPTVTQTPTRTATPTATGTATATKTPRPTATPAPPGTVADTCEPNDSLVAPCSLATEVDSAAMNFVDGSVDVYSFVLKVGRTYTISAKAQDGLDPVMTVYAAADPTKVVAQNDDVAANDLSAQVQLTPSVEAVYLVKVANKTSGTVIGKTYVMSAKAVAVTGDARTPVAVSGTPGTDVAPTTDPSLPFANIGDVYENNYDPDHATLLAWNTPYDLSQVCPDPSENACPGGDHDFLMVPVKKDVPFVAATYDLGPGADTLLTLYKPDPAQTLAGPGVYSQWMAVVANDDINPGWTLRSEIDLVPNWTGMALLVVAPSSRENPPPLLPVVGPPARYRLIVGAPNMSAVKQVLDAQRQTLPTTPTAATTSAAPSTAERAGAASNPPSVAVTPQPQPVVAATPASGAREIVREACATGTALTRKDGVKLYGAVPPLPSDELVAFPDGALMRLLGQCNAGWVKVQPVDSVMPGWMWGPDLQPDEVSPSGGTGTSTPATTPSAGAGVPTPGSLTTTPTPVRGTGSTSATGGALPTPSGPQGVTAEPLDAPPGPTDAVISPVAHALTVEICSGATNDLTTCTTPIAGLRVEMLLVATQQVQVAGVTDAKGKITLSTSVPAGTKLVLRVPALGLVTDVPDTATTLPIRVQGGSAA